MNSEPKTSKVRTVLIIVAVLLVFLIATSNSKSFKVGDDVTLKSNSQIIAAATSEDLSNAIKTASANDQYGWNQLIFTGKIFAVEDGTRAKVL